MTDDEPPTPAPRPSRPQIDRPAARTGQTGRPVRPGSKSRVVELPAVETPPPEPVIAETVLIAPPPEPKPPEPPRPPFFASRAVRQTLIPPCGVLAMGLFVLGIGYFFQPADAALRQIPASVPIILLAIGCVSFLCMVGLATSARSD